MNNILEYIENNQIDLPSLDGRTFQQIANDIINNRELFSQLLCLLTFLVNSKYISLPNEIAKTSIKAKKEKKLFIINIILDILKYLDMIEYVSISESLILAKITNDELANSLNDMKIKLIENNDKFKNLISELDKELSNNNEYLAIKDRLNGKNNTTVSK